MRSIGTALFALLSVSAIPVLGADVAVLAGKVYTMSGPPITDGVVIIRGGKIDVVGPAGSIAIPAGMRTLHAAVATPGLIDAHSTVGLSGLLNQTHDQEQLEKSSPVQPELRAIDAYNPRDRLIEWLRGFGVTTVNTGNSPGELMSGETMIVKLRGNTVEEAMVQPLSMVVANFGSDALESDRGKSPGTRAKQMAMLRGEFVKAGEYTKKIAGPADKRPSRDLHLEALAKVLDRSVPLLLTADRSQDIMSALRLAKEFNLRLVLDSAAESYLLIDQIKAAAVPVVLHATMARADDDRENMSFETAGVLRSHGIPVALQSGFEAYVPKTRVVLFEAALAAANGAGFDGALSMITIDAARILGIDSRVGSLEKGKDGDVALYDGDPFEYTTHCVATVIEGDVVSEAPH